MKDLIFQFLKEGFTMMYVVFFTFYYVLLVSYPFPDKIHKCAPGIFPSESLAGFYLYRLSRLLVLNGPHEN